MRQQRWFVVGNAGDLSLADVEQLRCHDSVRVCACDGAFDTLREAGLHCDVLIGDFDSVSSEALHAYRSLPRGHCVDATDQSKTDLEKAIIYIDRLQPLSIDLINVMGGRMDHSFYNARLLKRYRNPLRQLRLHDGDQWIMYTEDESIHLKGVAGTTVALLSFPRARVSSQGLQYELTDHVMSLDAGGDSVCNQLLQTSATIVISGGCLVVADKQVVLYR